MCLSRGNCVHTCDFRRLLMQAVVRYKSDYQTPPSIRAGSWYNCLPTSAGDRHVHRYRIQRRTRTTTQLLREITESNCFWREAGGITASLNCQKSMATRSFGSPGFFDFSGWLSSSLICVQDLPGWPKGRRTGLLFARSLRQLVTRSLSYPLAAKE